MQLVDSVRRRSTRKQNIISKHLNFHLQGGSRKRHHESHDPTLHQQSIFDRIHGRSSGLPARPRFSGGLSGQPSSPHQPSYVHAPWQ